MPNLKNIIFYALLVFNIYQRHAVASVFKVDSNIIGQPTDYIVNQDDNFYQIARKFDVGITEMLAANPGIDPWSPKAGSVISIPKSYILPNVERKGIVINLSQLRLYYFIDKQTVLSFPIGIGRDGWQTPIGKTYITWKRKDPTWTPPASIRAQDPDLPKIVPAGPDNPMGQYAIYLKLPNIAIHGTNKPNGIGSRSSHGCIRMFPEDIELLFSKVDKNTPVNIIDNFYALTWKDNILYLQVSPTQQQNDHIYENNSPITTAINAYGIYDDIIKLTSSEDKINWDLVQQIVDTHNGIPTPIISRK